MAVNISVSAHVIGYHNHMSYMKQSAYDSTVPACSPDEPKVWTNTMSFVKNSLSIYHVVFARRTRLDISSVLSSAYSDAVKAATHDRLDGPSRPQTSVIIRSTITPDLCD